MLFNIYSTSVIFPRQNLSNMVMQIADDLALMYYNEDWYNVEKTVA